MREDQHIPIVQHYYKSTIIKAAWFCKINQQNKIKIPETEPSFCLCQQQQEYFCSTPSPYFCFLPPALASHWERLLIRTQDICWTVSYWGAGFLFLLSYYSLFCLLPYGRFICVCNWVSWICELGQDLYCRSQKCNQKEEALLRPLSQSFVLQFISSQSSTIGVSGH